MVFRRRHLCATLMGSLLVMLSPALSLGQGRDEQPPDSDSEKAKPTQSQDEQPPSSDTEEVKATHGLFDLDYKYMTGDWAVRAAISRIWASSSRLR